jgi:hypothetical protein
VPLRVYHPPKKLGLREPPEKYSAASSGQKTEREKKLPDRQNSAGERGEIIAIVAVIELGFIGIIIIITSTIITIITSPSHGNIMS